MNPTNTKKYSAPALEKGLDILEYLSEVGTALSQAEIAQGLERSANEIYRLLIVLESRGFLIRDELSGKYRLSLRLYMLSHTHSPMEQLKHAALLPMMELAETTRHGCHMSIPFKNELLIVRQVKSPEPVSLSIAEGTLFPLLTTSSGRVLLANYSAEFQLDLLAREPTYTCLPSKEQNKILTQLAKIKEDGYHHATSEITAGVTDFAAFIGQVESGLTAAIAVSALTSRVGGKRDESKIIDELLQAADNINQRAGILSGEQQHLIE